MPFRKKVLATTDQMGRVPERKGLDPENQLCTDDFAGHLAHNANLSVKAISPWRPMPNCARLLGHDDSAPASIWTTPARTPPVGSQLAQDQNHYRLAFDKPDTWSQKYNLVWDRLLDLNIFPPTIIEKELAFYKSHVNKYGLPLDNRADYTKIDWLAWTASLAPSHAAFQELFDPAYQFANDSPNRVPLTDWYDTKTSKQVGFQARSVVGGIFIELLKDKTIWKRYAQADSH